LHGSEPARVIDFASAAIFVEREIISIDADIIDWGEHHYQVYQPSANITYTPTVTRYAQEILPVLARAGRRNLLLEAIPTGSEVQAEINWFYWDQNRQINAANTPFLWRSIQGNDSDGFLLLFNEARRLGVDIYGGGLTVEQARNTIWRGDYLQRNDFRRLAAGWVTQNMRDRVDELRRNHPGIRLDIYGGCAHNNIFVTAEDLGRGRNYGEYFRSRFGRRYVVVDLITPYDPPVSTCHARRPNRLSQRGVTVVNDFTSSYTLFFLQN